MGLGFGLWAWGLGVGFGEGVAVCLVAGIEGDKLGYEREGGREGEAVAMVMIDL